MPGLDKAKLQKNLKKMFDDLLPNAFAQALDETFSEKTKKGTEISQKFGETIKDLLSEDMSIQMSEIIDAYVKNANIHGTIITMGSAVTQTASINSPNVIINGKVPNTLKLD